MQQMKKGLARVLNNKNALTIRYTQTVKSAAIFAKQKYAPLLPACEL